MDATTGGGGRRAGPSPDERGRPPQLPATQPRPPPAEGEARGGEAGGGGAPGGRRRPGGAGAGRPRRPGSAPPRSGVPPSPPAPRAPTTFWTNLIQSQDRKSPDRKKNPESLLCFFSVWAAQWARPKKNTKSSSTSGGGWPAPGGGWGRRSGRRGGEMSLRAPSARPKFGPATIFPLEKSEPPGWTPIPRWGMRLDGEGWWPPSCNCFEPLPAVPAPPRRRLRPCQVSDLRQSLAEAR